MITLRSLALCVLVATTVVGTAPISVWAGEGPSAAELNEARERFAEARKLEEAGQFSEALQLFERVARVKMTPQVRFHIALCYMHTGKPVDALTNFRTAIDEAGSSSPNVVTEARQHIATLEKQVAVLTIHVHPTAPTPTVLLDERVVPTGTSFDAEPGAHRLRYQLSGETVEEQDLNLQKGTRMELEFKGAGRGDGSSTSGLRVASYVAFGVAGVSVVGIGTFAFLRADRLATVEAACPTLTGCSRDLEPVVRQGKQYASAANVLTGITAAAAVAGVVLYIVSPSAVSRARTSNFRVVPVLDGGTGFVLLEGRY